MTEKKLKGLFGGGEAGDAPSSLTAPQQRERRGKRGGGGGRRRRRHSPEERAQRQDFINRYMTGHPSEGFSSEEAVTYLRELREEAPPEVLQRAAVETVQRLPEDQRKAFAEMLARRQAGAGMVTIERTGEARPTQGRPMPEAGGSDDLLGGLFGGLFGGQPQPQPRQVPPSQGGFGADDMLGGLLGGLLGGGMAQTPSGRGAPAGDPFGGMLGGLFGGGDDYEPAPRQTQQPPEQQGGIGDILGSPLGKAVLGGIAAFAMKEMMDREGRL